MSATPEGAPVHRGAITVCVMLATIMQALDTTIANVALPYMQGTLSASQDQINWVLTSYIVAASLVPLSQSVLLDAYPRERQGSAMALWGMGVMVGPILGPTLGGWLTENYNWRWVFFINVPIGAFAVFGVFTYIKGEFLRRNTKFDFFGFATLSIAIGALQAM